ncbi:MAG: DNA translocase FtsK, partial [Lentisphaeria bacterium]
QLKTTKMPFFNVKGLKKTTPEFESEISAPTADALPSLKPEYTASQPVLFTELPSEPVTPPEMPQKVISGEAVKVKSAPGNYVLPPMKLLNQPVNSGSTDDHEEIEKKKQIIQMVLDNFQIDAEVVNAIVGPQVTLFEIAPAANVRINEIAKLHNNFAMELQATTLRLLLPIPGQRLVGIEVPNANPRKVFSYELMESESWHHSKMKIPLILGKNIGGETVMLDLARAPHLLIAGATGSGKSVCMNLLITSMLYKFNPDELRLIMIDPKVVEFQPYSTLPHLIVPVITEVDKVSLALRWVINEMERRYRVLAKVGVRNLDDFNNRQISKEEPLDDGGNVIPQKLPYIVVIIDELADIMLYAQKEVEKGLAAIAAKSRAVGIHSIIATQRPDTKVLTGTIKSNYPTRIAFRVPSQIDSRTILDTKGAESLLGRGDMLFKGMRSTERLQGGMIEQAEMERLVSFVSVQAEQHFDEDVLKTQEELAAESAEFDFSGDGGRSESMSLEDKQYREAVEIVLRDKRPTISYLQRTLKIGYNKAADLIDRMERQGVIGPQPSHGNREILVASSAGLNIDDDDLRDDEIDFEDA